MEHHVYKIIVMCSIFYQIPLILYHLERGTRHMLTPHNFYLLHLLCENCALLFVLV